MEFNLNGEQRETEISASMSLADMLRDVLNLTGTKRGCDTGGCGMCTVLVDGRAVYSCMTPAWRVEGRRVETVEGLITNGRLHPLQEAFIKNSAAQCGYCTAGILMAAKALLDSNLAPSEEEIRDALSGVICRCTGYLPYLESIREAASTMMRSASRGKR